MSTRSHVRFIVKSKYRDHKTNKVKNTKQSGLTYRHSDGYPEGILPDLIEFLKWNGFRNEDIEYTAANWVFHQKRSAEHYVAESYKWDKEKKGKKYDWKDGWKEAHPNVSMLHTGYGICFDNELHGDIEYYYEVIHEVDSTQNENPMSDGRVKAEIHCYRPLPAPRDENDRRDWDAPIKIESQPFAKVIFKPGDHKYEVEKLEGLTKEFKVPE